MKWQWQPIETAPIKPFDAENWFMPHSPQFLLWIGRPVIGNYSYTKHGKGRWRDFVGNVDPSHWMPLPPPPEGT
jgi:hypothetical protein